MKRFTLVVASAFVGCCVVGTANAQIVPIGEFTGDHSEGFEGLPFGFFASHPVFDNTGVVQSIDGGGTLNITSSWSFFGINRLRSGPDSKPARVVAPINVNGARAMLIVLACRPESTVRSILKSSIAG